MNFTSTCSIRILFTFGEIRCCGSILCSNAIIPLYRLISSLTLPVTGGGGGVEELPLRLFAVERDEILATLMMINSTHSGNFLTLLSMNRDLWRHPQGNVRRKMRSGGRRDSRATTFKHRRFRPWYVFLAMLLVSTYNLHSRSCWLTFMGRWRSFEVNRVHWPQMTDSLNDLNKAQAQSGAKGRRRGSCPPCAVALQWPVPGHCRRLICWLGLICRRGLICCYLPCTWRILRYGPSKLLCPTFYSHFQNATRDGQAPTWSGSVKSWTPMVGVFRLWRRCG